MPDPSPKTRENTALGGRVSLHQPVSGYRAAIDPVLLAAAAPARKGMHVLDAGCGVGTAGLCLATRIPGITLTGIDIQADLVELARQNAVQNAMADNSRFDCGDISAPPADIKSDAGKFDMVISNPPFLDSASYSPSPDAVRSTANATAETTPLNTWISFAARMLKAKGQLVMIHRGDHLPQILAGMASCAFGNIRIFPLWPREGRPAKRVLVGGVKGSKAPAALLPGMVLHKGAAERDYTSHAHNVLYDAAGIDLWA